MGAVLDYLRVARAQTAAVEGAGFPLAAWIGGAPLWSLPLFALFGVLSHFGGFGENGITDLAYDRQDPAKLHHPLVSGRLSFRRGVVFVYSCQAAAIALFVVLLALSPAAHHLWPVEALIAYVVLGHLYNFIGKEWKPGAVAEISGAFAFAFLACGTLWTGGANWLVWTVMVYAFAMTAFQIAVAGELKELGQKNEKNLLRRLGMRVVGTPLETVPAITDVVAAIEREGGTVRPKRPGQFLAGSADATVFYSTLTTAKVAVLLSIAYYVWPGDWELLVGAATFVVLIVYQIVLTRPGAFDRPGRVRTMGLGEAASYLLLVFVLAPLFGWWLVAGFVVLPVVWFVSMNRALWEGSGSVFAPGV
jgi:4-hydroxybenzoate polyprenyltransferase